MTAVGQVAANRPSSPSSTPSHDPIATADRAIRELRALRLETGAAQLERLAARLAAPPRNRAQIDDELRLVDSLLRRFGSGAELRLSLDPRRTLPDLQVRLIESALEVRDQGANRRGHRFAGADCRGDHRRASGQPEHNERSSQAPARHRP